ncbi:MAG: zinc ribbon domain-containing protein [Sphingomonadales bacterium]|nr:MAG: zinc ribbon domain-containing protein [Sphingomonadales bacterium]
MWRWIKIPKAIALLAFALPWLTVSCGSQKFLTASGVNLTTGRMSVTNPMTNAVQSQAGSINYWLAAAVFVIVIGLAATFIAQRRGALLVLITSAAAFVLTWIGTDSITRAFSREIAKQSAREPSAATNPFGTPDLEKMMALIRFDWQIGYWTTMAALLVAGIMAWLVFSGRESLVVRARDTAVDGPAPGTAARITCPNCGRTYPASTRFCPDDGTALG